MKRILGAAFVSLALLGSVSTASAIEVPRPDATLQEHLNFWQLFNGNGSGSSSSIA